MKVSSKLKTIIAFAKLGMKILPLIPKGKKPVINGGVYSATYNKKQIKRYFRDHRDANYGIATGNASDLIIVDIDGKPGEKSLRKLQDKHGDLPKTVTVKTGKGFHLWF